MNSATSSAETGSLGGRVALVTGAGQGMGKSIATALARAGARVAVSDIQTEAAGRASQGINEVLGAELTAPWTLDVTDEDEVGTAVSDIVDRYGTISILVNNAGILYPTRFADITTREWTRVMDVNLTGTFYCARAVLPHMRAAGFGRIVNLSSSAGRSVSTLGGAHYTTAKAGVLGLTRALAKEVAADGILVNAVCPGLIDTEMVRNNCKPAMIEAYEESFPIKRLGLPEEVADTVVFLCTTGSYITGASIDVNGGDLMI